MLNVCDNICERQEILRPLHLSRYSTLVLYLDESPRLTTDSISLTQFEQEVVMQSGQVLLGMFESLTKFIYELVCLSGRSWNQLQVTRK
jgi:hypothetical protein